MSEKDRDEQHELEEAGWERVEREGDPVWRNPQSGLSYPQGVAVAMLREGAGRVGDVPKNPEGGA